MTVIDWSRIALARIQILNEAYQVVQTLKFRVLLEYRRTDKGWIKVVLRVASSQAKVDIFNIDLCYEKLWGDHWSDEWFVHVNKV